MTDILGKINDVTIRFALRAARENEDRWIQMSPEFSADSEQMAQWRSTARTPAQ